VVGQKGITGFTSLNWEGRSWENGGAKGRGKKKRKCLKVKRDEGRKTPGKSSSPSKQSYVTIHCKKPRLGSREGRETHPLLTEPGHPRDEELVAPRAKEGKIGGRGNLTQILREGNWFQVKMGRDLRGGKGTGKKF